MPHKENWPYLLYFCILDNKNISRDSRDIKVDPYWVQDPSWSFNGPYRAPKMDLMIFEPISGSLYHFYIVHNDVPL